VTKLKRSKTDNTFRNAVVVPNDDWWTNLDRKRNIFLAQSGIFLLKLNLTFIYNFSQKIKV